MRPDRALNDTRHCRKLVCASCLVFTLSFLRRFHAFVLLSGRGDKLPFSHTPVFASSTFHFPVTAWWLGRPGAHPSNPTYSVSPTLHDSQVVGSPEKPTLLLSKLAPTHSACKSHNHSAPNCIHENEFGIAADSAYSIAIAPRLGRPVGKFVVQTVDNLRWPAKTQDEALPQGDIIETR